MSLSVKKTKNFGALILPLLLGIFVCLVVGVECMKRASVKGFEGDEATDFHTTLAVPSWNMIVGNVNNQWSGSPLFFVAQREVVRKFLRDEKEKGQGWDWRITMRLVPTASIVLGCFFAFLLLYRIHLGFALAVPVLLANHTHVTWYGAEGRLHGPWIGVSLFFYTASIAFGLNPRSLKLGLVWVLSVMLLVGVAITSPGQVFAVATAMAVFQWYNRSPRDGQQQKLFWSFLAVGLVVTLVLFKLWSVTGQKSFGLMNATRSFEQYVSYFKDQALSPLGGMQGLIQILLLIGAFFSYARWGRNEAVRRFMLLLALICLSQLPILVVIFIAQILSGYFFADRHVIFGVVVRSMVSAGFAVLCFYVFVETIQKKVAAKKQHLLTGAALFVTVLSIAFDWIHWSVLTLPSGILGLKRAHMTYCHGPVLPDRSDLAQVEYSNQNALILDTVNQKRHAGLCEKDLTRKGLVDFSPRWIYGD